MCPQKLLHIHSDVHSLFQNLFFNYIATVDDEPDDDGLSTGVAVTISIVVTFIITLVVTALITLIIISLYYKHLINHIKKSTVVQEDTSDAHLAFTTKTNIAMTNADPWPADVTLRNNAVTETTIMTNITVLEADSAYTLTS